MKKEILFVLLFFYYFNLGTQSRGTQTQYNIVNFGLNQPLWQHLKSLPTIIHIVSMVRLKFRDQLKLLLYIRSLFEFTAESSVISVDGSFPSINNFPASTCNIAI